MKRPDAEAPKTRYLATYDYVRMDTTRGSDAPLSPPAVWLDTYSGRWVTPDDWHEAQRAEASRRRGLRFALRNWWLRIRGRPYYVGGGELALGAQLLHDAEETER